MRMFAPKATFEKILPQYLHEYRNEVSTGTVKDFGWAWKQLGPHFARLVIAKLTPDVVEQYKAKRLDDGVKKATINRELCYLGNIIKFAENKDLIHPLPFRVKKFRRRDTRSPVPTVHTPEEISRILAEIKPNKRGLFLLMYDAGLRRSEACNLKGSRVDVDSRQIRVLGKGNKERVIPILTDRLLRELVLAKGVSGSGMLYVNPKTGEPFKSILTSLRSASKRAGVDKHVYHHLLRHDHGTHAAMAGVDARAVQRLLGHADLGTTEIYMHLSGDYLKSEGSKFSDYISNE